MCMYVMCVLACHNCLHTIGSCVLPCIVYCAIAGLAHSERSTAAYVLPKVEAIVGCTAA